MTLSDILISVMIALAVNLATPLVRLWLLSLLTKFKSKATSAGTKALETRLKQLEESLAWYQEKRETKNLLEWLLPQIFYQIIFLWVLVLLPYFVELINGLWGISDVVFKGGIYGIVGLCTRYFITFIIVATMAQKALSYSETENNILNEIKKLKERLSEKSS